MHDAAPMQLGLAARNIVPRYGGVLALDDVSIEIGRGEFLSILGSSGAGKTTLSLILSGLMTPTSGGLIADGEKQAAAGKPLKGVCLVPEGRRLFGQLTVVENLLLGGYGADASSAEIKERMGEVLAGLPKALRDDPTRFAATLSGGEQQMLAIGRALMAGPPGPIQDATPWGGGAQPPADGPGAARPPPSGGVTHRPPGATALPAPSPPP